MIPREDPSAPFRSTPAARALLAEIEALVKAASGPVRFMEVCGTHTMSAARAGLHSLLPPGLRLSSGPGCPVCVTGPGYIAAACDLARRHGVAVATFGDLVRVPGAGRSLEDERAEGADVRVVYGPLDALALARAEPDREIVFLGVGFETTAPTVAATILAARREGLRNFSVLCAHKTMPAAMRAILESADVSIRGFLCPGHVTVITGPDLYAFIPREYRVPCVIAGFEPVEILLGIRALLRQVVENRAAVENAYGRAVTATGNARARAVMEEVFEPSDEEWRGIGMIPGSGLAVREAFAGFDARRKLGVEWPDVPPPENCLCGEILRGAAEPADCPLFGTLCTPASPVGACMVSSEGACAAAHRYGVAP